MIEKIQIGQAFEGLSEVSAVDKLIGVTSSGDGKKINPSALPYGCGVLSTNMDYGVWYRIAIGGIGNHPSSGLFNIGNIYGNAASRGILFHAFATGYGDGQIVNKIAGTTASPISKIRLLVKTNNMQGSESMLDILPSVGKTNTYRIAASCLLGFTLQKPVAVTDTDIPSGYSVKDFTF